MAETESLIMQENNHPNLIKMKYYFQSLLDIFFVMKYIQGGELKSLLREKKTFSEEVVKFYAVQIVDAVKSLHDR